MSLAKHIPAIGELEARAKAFAEAAHGSINQLRKYTNEPYIVHPAAVVELVRRVPHTEEMLAAAWLHDVVEDTPVTLSEVEGEFGPRVAALVEQLTDVSRPEDGNRVERKALDRAHTAKASVEAKTIKLADLIDNTQSIVAHDPSFAKVYLAEKALLLGVLQEGDPTLLKLACQVAAPRSFTVRPVMHLKSHDGSVCCERCGRLLWDNYLPDGHMSTTDQVIYEAAWRYGYMLCADLGEWHL